MAIWADRERDGDLRLFVGRSFSQNASSETVAIALYPFNRKEPCVVWWKSESGAEVIALQLESGRAATVKNGGVGFKYLPVPDGLLAIKIWLYSKDDPDKKRLAEREFFEN